MARLQDFSDVTPSSSSDKLLIVQSAGQGLATLDTAGQQIANNTRVSQLHTTSKTLVGAVNEVNGAISYKEYVVQIGTSLWNGVYYAETNVATDVLKYGKILSAIVIDESEQSNFSSHTNRACFCQVITPNVIRLYSPQASNASGHYVKYRVTFSANAVNRT